jgi:type IV secretion system protein VirB10
MAMPTQQAAPKPKHPSAIVFVQPPAPVAKPAQPVPPEVHTRLAFKGAELSGVKASAAIDDTYQLMPGLLLCVLDVAINSDLPGPLACHLPGPVYSPKGVLLMEAETQVMGKYETVKNGQSRLMASSVMAHTPNGIWVPLAGEPFADALGRTGMDGVVDHHYFERFGAAGIMTVGESLLGIAQAAVSKGGNSYLSLNTGSSGVGSLAQEILRSQINIPATLPKDQGSLIALWITNPIDFSDSYKIREVR